LLSLASDDQAVNIARIKIRNVHRTEPFCPQVKTPIDEAPQTRDFLVKAANCLGPQGCIELPGYGEALVQRLQRYGWQRLRGKGAAKEMVSEVLPF